MTYAKRTDKNQTEIVKTLRKIGCEVLILSSVGFGVSDLLVDVFGFLYLIELKDGDKSPSQRKLTPSEQRFSLRWAKHYHVIESVSQALEFVNSRVPNV